MEHLRSVTSSAFLPARLSQETLRKVHDPPLYDLSVYEYTPRLLCRV